MQLKNPFKPYKMKNLIIPNRIVFAGHGSRFVDPHLHELTDRQAYYLAERETQVMSLGNLLWWTEVNLGRCRHTFRVEKCEITER